MVSEISSPTAHSKHLRVEKLLAMIVIALDEIVEALSVAMLNTDDFCNNRVQAGGKQFGPPARAPSSGVQREFRRDLAVRLSLIRE
jgi:hypothetical protein